MSLTPAGRTLLRHADVMVDRLAQAERDIDDLLTGRTDQLRVGTFQSVSVKLLPSMVQRLRNDRPGVEISLLEHDDIRLLVDGLLHDDLDLAFLVGPYVDARVQCEWLCQDRFVVISPAPAPGAPIRPDELAGASLVGMPPTPCQAIIDDGLRAHGVAPRFVFRSGDNGAIQAMVRAGMGDAVMPYLGIDAADPGIVVRELDPPIPPRVVGLAQRVGVTLSPAAEYFVELARSVCRDMDSLRV